MRKFSNKKLVLSKTDRLAIREFHERLSGFLGRGLRKLALFGSKLEGHATPQSDIDLLVLIQDRAAVMRNQIFDAAFEVNLKYGVYISPRIVTLSTYNHPVWKMTPFLKGLRSSGIPV